MNLFDDVVPFRNLRKTRQLVRDAAAHANTFGITQLGAIESLADVRDVLIPLDERRRLTLRIAATIYDEHDSVEEWRPTLDWIARNRHPSPLVRILGFKGYMDGSLGSRTALMAEPYLDNPPGIDPENAGIARELVPNLVLRDLVLLGAKLDLQPALHAIGDRANQTALDWYAIILPTIRQRIRPRIEHAQHLLPEDVPRFAELSVIPSMQPYHKADDGRYALRRIGHERCRTSYAFRQLLDSGAALAFGSDWPVVSVNPWRGVHAAVTAQTLDGATFIPEQSITVEEALRAYTTGAAFALHAEDSTGMLREGLRADFAILDRDPLSIPEGDIPDTTATLTVLDGRIVHDAR